MTGPDDDRGLPGGRVPGHQPGQVLLGRRMSAGRARVAGEVKAPAVPLTTTRAKIGPTAVGSLRT